MIGALSGATAAVIGFGIGSLLTPLLLLQLTPETAVAAVALPHLLATAVRYARHAGAVDRQALLRFGLLSAAGGLAGALVQGAVGGSALLAVLGALLMVAWRNAGWIGLDRWLIPLTQGAGPAPATAEPARQGAVPG